MSQPAASITGNHAAPEVTKDEATALAKHLFGLDAVKVSSLGSCEDANFRIKLDGGRSYVLKIANRRFAEAELDLQNRAMQHIAARLVDARVVLAVPNPLSRVAATYPAASGDPAPQSQ